MPLSQSIWALPVNLFSSMAPLLFLVLMTFFSTFPCTDFRSTLFLQHTFLVATTSYAQHINSELITWRRGVVGITAAQLDSTKPKLRFYAGSSPARGVLEIHDGKDHRQLFQLEVRLNALRWSTIPQKQFIIIITTDRAKRCDYELGQLRITIEWQNTMGFCRSN